MSLILEALRKSEAERRRAQAPDLFAPVQAAPVPERRLPPAWIAGGLAVLVLAVALMAMRGIWSGGSVEPAAAPAERAPATRASAARVPDPPRRLPLASAAPRPVGMPEAPPPPAPASVEPDAGDASPPVVDATQPATPLPSRSSDTPRVDATDATPAAPAPPAVHIDASSADGSGPLRLAELAPASRRELPPLKLTMHMWNEAAARRFVIVDGRRLAEGDRLGAVQVAEIRRDGVLLDWNGQRLLLPLR